MNIVIDRKYKKPNYTISNLTVDGVWLCNVIEDKDYGWNQKTPLNDISATKIKHKSQTAIPSGKYRLSIDVVSPTFSKKSYYQSVCNGRVPRLINVPGFDGILIHTGNTEKDSAGCLIVGYNTSVGCVTESKRAFEILYKNLSLAKTRNEQIWIEVL